jgi:hypothetical protein
MANHDSHDSHDSVDTNLSWWERPMSRRRGVQLGIGGLAGGSFLDLFRLVRAARAADPAGRAPSNCILIWMDGGPTHFETFDPKPDAPAEIRGAFSPIATNVPGIRFCELLPRTARHADKLAIVRSLCTNDDNHDE